MSADRNGRRDAVHDDRLRGRRGAARRSLAGGAAVAGALLVAALGLAAAEPAGARPTPPSVPSAGQVQQARSAADAKAAQVTQLQASLIAASARLDATRTAAEQAAEAYNGALLKLSGAQQSARLAGANASAAGASYDQARAQVGRIAAQTYRDGGQPSLLIAVLGPGGPQDVLDRAAVVDTLGAERSQAMQRMDATRVVATMLSQQADDAVRQQKAATDALASARDRAQATTQAEAATVAATQVEQTRLLAELASLQHTSVVLEQQRQAGLAAQAAAAAEAAAAAARARNSDASGSGSGSGSGRSGVGTTVPVGSSQGSATAGEVAVAWAKQQLGLPYQWGGAGPGSYDCSGLTMRAWQHAGVSLPHYAASQYDQSAKVPYSQLRPGDLIFYATDTSSPASIHHVTMYIGGGQMIEAPYTGANVRIVPIRWNESMPWAGRP